MTQNLKARSLLARRNAVRAKDLWPAYSSKPMLKVLRELTTTFGFSIELGELRIIDGHWYVTHTGLLGRCAARIWNCFLIPSVMERSKFMVPVIPEESRNWLAQWRTLSCG